MRAIRWVRERFDGLAIFVAVLFVLGCAAAAWAQSDPQMLQDPGVVITNAGAVGRDEGFNVTISTSAETDILSLASVPLGDLRNYVRNAAIANQIRFVTVKRIFDDATDTKLALCFRMGPSTAGATVPSTGPSSTNPPLVCKDVNVASNTGTKGSTGGCYLIGTGDSCTWNIRQVVPSQCSAGGSNWTTCHQPLWSLASGGTDGGALVNVSFHW